MKKKVLVLLINILAIILALAAAVYFIILPLTQITDQSNPAGPSETTGNDNIDIDNDLDVDNDIEADNAPDDFDDTLEGKASSDPKDEETDTPEDQTGSQQWDQTSTSEPDKEEQPAGQETQGDVELKENMTDKG